MKIPALVTFLVLIVTAATEIKPVGNVCVSADEQKLYDLIMAYRKEKKFTGHSVIGQAYAGGTNSC